MVKKLSLFGLLACILCTTIVKANPVIMILPIETTGFSDYEESVINALIASLVQTTEAYQIVDREQVRLQLNKLDKTPGKDQASTASISEPVTYCTLKYSNTSAIAGAKD